MDTYDLVIIATLVGFLAVAFLLLAPVYRFLKREEEASKAWTPEEVARRRRARPPSGDGAGGEGEQDEQAAR